MESFSLKKTLIAGMGNYIWLDQGVVIENMQLGLKTDNQDIPLTSVDEFIG